jgi:putative ABC transport system ATP-binding protein
MTATRSTSAATPFIELSRLCRTYVSGEVKVHAVRDVSLTIGRGDFVAVMGSSGSGKSTLMNTLGCLDRPTSGSYRLDGIDVDGLDRSALAHFRNHRLGFVFQGFHLLPRTSALENVELPLLYRVPMIPASTRRSQARNALERVGLAERLDHHPSQLSGGQQQRVAIARALVTQPDLILADEPTGNLDTRTSIEVMALFQDLNAAGITIVMVTHEPDIAAFCHRTILMRDGRIVSDTRPSARRDARRELAGLPVVDLPTGPSEP